MKKSVFACSVLATAVAFAGGAVVPKPKSLELLPGAGVVTTSAIDASLCRFVKDAALPPEGYELTVKDGEVVVKSADDDGAFYALETLKQLADVDVDMARIPAVHVKDAPRYRWRGVMIDDGRHFFGKDVVLKVVDLMAQHKLNVLHWHLTEDQGWRIEIKKYPELVRYGSVRPKSPRYDRRDKPEEEFDNVQYGPYFYTQDEIREVLAYAKSRHITVVPEIELPGHNRAALAAYPEFSCAGKDLPRVPRCTWGVEDDILCAGNDDAIRFYENVLDEVCALFPSTTIHIGGDEAPRVRWKTCPKCQARMKANGLKTEAELQSWVTKHFVDYLAKKGRRALGWDEILEGGLAPGAIVMSWRGAEGGIAAAKMDHDVVMTPNTHCYFDYDQRLEDDPHVYIGCRLPLHLAYSFDPCAGIPATHHRHVLGGQCNNWAEHTFNRFDLDWKMWPRTCALAEALWTADPKRDYQDFIARMRVHRKRLVAQGVNAAPLDERIDFCLYADRADGALVSESAEAVPHADKFAGLRLFPGEGGFASPSNEIVAVGTRNEPGDLVRGVVRSEAKPGVAQTTPVRIGFWLGKALQDRVVLVREWTVPAAAADRFDWRDKPASVTRMRPMKWGELNLFRAIRAGERLFFEIVPEAEKPALVLRFDDNKPTNQWQEVAGIFEAIGGRCSFAVNPSWLVEEQWAALRDLSRRGHEIMDHTMQHALFRLDLPTAEAAATYKAAGFFDHAENGGRTILCRPELDLAHSGNVRVQADMTNGVLRSSDPAFVKAQHFSQKLFVPSTGKLYGLGKDCGGGLFKKGAEQKCSDFWGRWTADSFGPCEVVLLDDAAAQPSLELLRAQAKEVATAFAAHGLPPPKTWIRPGGWEQPVDWRRMKAVYGDEFGYAVVDSTSGDGLKPFSRWNYGSDFGFFDFVQDVDKVYAKAADAIASGRSFAYISHQWTADRAKYLEQCRQLAAKLKAGGIRMTTYSRVADGTDNH